VKEIKKHLLFNDTLDWAALIRKEIRPPWMPPRHGDLDLQHFPSLPENTQDVRGNNSTWTPIMW